MAGFFSLSEYPIRCLVIRQTIQSPKLYHDGHNADNQSQKQAKRSGYNEASYLTITFWISFPHFRK